MLFIAGYRYTAKINNTVFVFNGRHYQCKICPNARWQTLKKAVMHEDVNAHVIHVRADSSAIMHYPWAGATRPYAIFCGRVLHYIVFSNIYYLDHLNKIDMAYYTILIGIISR